MTISIITAEELAAYLGTKVTPSITMVVDLTNDLITEAWACPVDPVPAYVRALALTVASRGASNPKGLSSWTRSWDDVTRTERMENDGSGRTGVYLTDGEYELLNGTPATSVMVGTIHTPRRGDCTDPLGVGRARGRRTWRRGGGTGCP